MSLRGRRALVTGGGRGIGRATALALAGAGVEVAVAARTKAEVEAVAREVRGLGVRGVALTADVGQAEGVRALFGAAREALGGIEVEELSPQKRLVTAQEVAALVLYLCGEEARGITGQGL